MSRSEKGVSCCRGLIGLTKVSQFRGSGTAFVAKESPKTSGQKGLEDLQGDTASVWLYFRFSTSYRYVEEMMAVRGLTLNLRDLFGIDV